MAFIQSQSILHSPEFVFVVAVALAREVIKATPSGWSVKESIQCLRNALRSNTDPGAELLKPQRVQPRSHIDATVYWKGRYASLKKEKDDLRDQMESQAVQKTALAALTEQLAALRSENKASSRETAVPTASSPAVSNNGKRKRKAADRTPVSPTKRSRLEVPTEENLSNGEWKSGIEFMLTQHGHESRSSMTRLLCAQYDLGRLHESGSKTDAMTLVAFRNVCSGSCCVASELFEQLKASDRIESQKNTSDLTHRILNRSFETVGQQLASFAHVSHAQHRNEAASVALELFKLLKECLCSAITHATAPSSQDIEPNCAREMFTSGLFANLLLSFTETMKRMAGADGQRTASSAPLGIVCEGIQYILLTRAGQLLKILTLDRPGSERVCEIQDAGPDRIDSRLYRAAAMEARCIAGSVRVAVDLSIHFKLSRGANECPQQEVDFCQARKRILQCTLLKAVYGSEVGDLFTPALDLPKDKCPDDEQLAALSKSNDPDDGCWFLGRMLDSVGLDALLETLPQP